MTVNGAELAQILGLSKGRVSQLKSDGVLVAVSGGKFDLPKAIQAYIAHLESGAASPELTAHRAKLIEQQTRRLKLANDRAEKLVVNLADVRQLIMLNDTVVRTQLQALPGRIASDVATCQGNSALVFAKLRDEMNRVLTAMANETASLAEQLGSITPEPDATE